MSKFNFLELASAHNIKYGRLLLTDMPRLLEALTELGASEQDVAGLGVDYTLQGQPVRQFEDESYPVFTLSLEATFPLRCQRCLQPMPQSQKLGFTYVVAETLPEALQDDDTLDWLDPKQELSLEALIEDEMLMALPIAVMHDYECQSVNNSSGKPANPFAVLAQLKNSNLLKK